MELFEVILLIPTSILLGVVLSQYVILLKPKKNHNNNFSPPVSILVPAHNEGKFIEGTVNSLVRAQYRGEKEIIVIDDGSSDETPVVLQKLSKQKGIKTLRTNHIGKSKALNKAMELSKNDIIVIVDGDSEIEGEALSKIVKPLAEEGVGASAGTIKIQNKKEALITWFQKVEYLYFSFFRSLCDRINGTIFTPGPLSAYRKRLVQELDGFSASHFMEDVDISLRIIRKGFRIRIVEDAITKTNAPASLRDWAKQRKRWMRGGIEIIKSNRDLLFNKRFSGSGFYSLPLLAYWYFHSLIMGILIFYQIFGGYYSYFFVHGNVISLGVIQYFLYWFSILGIINLAYQILTGVFAPNILIIMSITITLLTYPLYTYPFRKFRESFGWRDLFVLFFLFPYWVLILFVQSWSNINWLRPAQGRNWWKK